MKYDACVRHGAGRGRDRDGEQPWTIRLGSTFFFLTNRSTGVPVQPALDFLADRFVRKNGQGTLKFSPATRSAYAYDLAAFHWYLDQRGLQVADIRPVDLTEYLDTFTTQCSPATGRPYARATLIRNRNSVLMFVQWLERQGYLKSTEGLDAYIEAAQGAADAGISHLVTSDGRRPPNAPIDRVIRAPNPGLLRELMLNLGPDPVRLAENQSVRIADSQSCVRLMAELALNAGLRRAEVCSLVVAQFEDLELGRKKDFGATAIRIVGKGAKSRDVPVPNWLIRAIQAYIRKERRDVCDRAERWASERLEPDALFLLGTLKRNVVGAPVSPRQLNRVFACARDRLAKRLENRPNHTHLLGALKQTLLTFHSLRHAFAITTYHNRRLMGDPDPSKYVQSILGHSDKETTERMYLRASHVMESELSDFWTEVTEAVIYAS